MKKLSPEQLRKTYDPLLLPPERDKNNGTGKAIVGQERAVSALKFGLGNKGKGFNIFVAGVPGTGKQTAVRHFLEDLVKLEPSPDDWVYVNNFQDPYQPRRLNLPKGRARVFRNDIYQFLLTARAALLKVFESEEYSNKREELVQKLRTQGAALLEEITAKAQKGKFLIQRTPLEFIAAPMVDDRPMTDQEFLALSEQEQADLLQKQETLKAELRLSARKMREMEKQTDLLLHELERQVAIVVLDNLLEDLNENYKEIEKVLDFLKELETDILEHLTDFIQFKGEEQEEGPLKHLKKNNGIPRRYEVNVFVDNAKTDGAPIVLELNPTYNNLFGKIEKESVMGAWVTDFTLIRGGALHAANGGYLILPAMELLRSYFSWDSLKRALRNGEIVIEEPGEQLGFLATKSLKPEPLPLNLQVILIGSPLVYALLYEYDEDFKELFKVKADFDTTMDYSEKNLGDFMDFIQEVCVRENLLGLDSGGLTTLIEYSHRQAEDQDKISIRFGEIIDLVKEANHYARKEAKAQIAAVHVHKAIEERLYRSNLWQEKIQEMIAKKLILIDVEGEKAGQVNGISVINLGDISFGRPNRITVSISAGRGGIVDIEREAKLSGPIHTKGVLILSGYLMEKFGQDKALSLSAHLVFEQSYSEIEGDSASSTELYALLSALSGLPIKQSIAVTGSVNQKGEIQAVGGINEKIEGFFDICRLSGLTGDQGVIIPQSNIKNLMLKEELVNAVREGKFHVWAVQTIEEGIELLTGRPAGKLLTDPLSGDIHFEQDSVFERVNSKLVALDAIVRNSEEPGHGKPPRELWRRARQLRGKVHN